MAKSTTKQPQLYTFRAEVLDYPEDSWRDIQILSNQTFGELGAAVLAAFESKGYHAWNLETSDAYFEYNLDGETAEMHRQRGAVAGEPDDKTIADLEFNVDDQMKLDYDYGTTWSFLLTVTKMEPAPGAKKSSYPRVSDGHGARMIDDVAPFELHELMEYQKKGETIKDHPEFEDLISEEDLDWRYDDFDLAKLRKRFPDSYRRMRQTYRSSPSSDTGAAHMNPQQAAFLRKVLKTLDRMQAEAEAGTGARKKTKKTAAKPPTPRIFTFRFESAEHPEDFWREVEMTSEATIGDLATAVLAAFETEPDHLWSVYHKGMKYYHYDEDDNPFYDGKKHGTPVRAYDVTLGELGLRARSRLEMMYDYGAPWYFNLRVIATRQQTQEDKPANYPRLLAGEGMPLVDGFPMDLNWAINDDLKNGRDPKDNEFIAQYVYDLDDFWFPQLDLEKAQKKFQKDADTLSAMYSTGTPF